MPAACG